MVMTNRQSKLVLTAHITFSVGWLGAVAVFIALAITGITSKNIQLAKASYLAMEISSWYVIVPFCLAAFITGIIQSLGTKWGLFKYYWIVAKLLLTIVATILLLMHLKPISTLSGIAAGQKFQDSGIRGSQLRILTDAGAGFLVLATILTISVYKPWGKTQGALNIEIIKKSKGKYIAMGLVAVILTGVILFHLLSGKMHGVDIHQMK